jgi:hypothetical protein
MYIQTTNKSTYMKKFTITETRPVRATWTYEVEAETEAEAISIIENGEAEPTSCEIEDHEDDDISEFQVIE